MTAKDVIFTIGHSTHPQDRFIDLLRVNGITALCDVRSKPFSSRNSQFNREALEEALPLSGIQYRFLGKELGARSDNPQCYVNGKIQYDLLANTEQFRYGLKRVLVGIRQVFRIALMCAEKEPLECHRSILVARHLDLMGIEVNHIHRSGQLESHSAAMTRLVRMLFLMEDDMFLTPEELVEKAYRRQGERIAYAMDEDTFIRRAAE
jgi:uncharacterized protein (DUF488 family)